MRFDTNCRTSAISSLVVGGGVHEMVRKKRRNHTKDVLTCAGALPVAAARVV